MLLMVRAASFVCGYQLVQEDVHHLVDVALLQIIPLQATDQGNVHPDFHVHVAPVDADQEQDFPVGVVRQ